MCISQNYNLAYGVRSVYTCIYSGSNNALRKCTCVCSAFGYTDNDCFVVDTICD